MDIKALILLKLNEHGEVKTSEIVKETGFSRVYIQRFFQELREEGKILLIGKANKAKYILAKQKEFDKEIKKIKTYHRYLINKDLHEDSILGEIKLTTGIFTGVTENVSQIVSYAFLEMLNNAIEHSESSRIEVVIKNDDHIISFKVIDEGIGIFVNIARKFNLEMETQAIRELLKGKLTTARSAHSGEGIFFTSKAADHFFIHSSDKKLIFNNVIHDQYIKKSPFVKGTKVGFSIETESIRMLNEIFKRYTDNSYEFKKTEVKVKLYQLGADFLSRSQARRIVSGLEKFSHVVLDFSGVKNIGQGFADEIFRVWNKDNPHITISYINANEDTVFMINHVQNLPLS
jgi:anti-sigma regulatory factor (Ser/Thr protein kinase)